MKAVSEKRGINRGERARYQKGEIGKISRLGREGYKSDAKSTRIFPDWKHSGTIIVEAKVAAGTRLKIQWVWE